MVSVLIALDAVFQVKAKQHSHPDVKNYYDVVGNRDKKLLAYVVDGYANEIINRCALMVA